MKLRNFLCVLLFLLLLSGCSNESPRLISIPSHEGTATDISATVDVSAKMITVGEDVYTYEKRADYITVVWPDGITYTQEKRGETWFRNVSGTVNTEQYLSQNDLLEILERIPEEKGINWFSVLVILLGVLMLIYPKIFWFLRYGLYFRDAEMSPVAGVIFRGIGAIIIVVGIWLL